MAVQRLRRLAFANLSIFGVLICGVPLSGHAHDGHPSLNTTPETRSATRFDDVRTPLLPVPTDWSFNDTWKTRKIGTKDFYFAENGPFAVTDSGNIIERAVRVRVVGNRAPVVAVPEDNLPVLLQPGQCCRVGVIIAVVVGNGNRQELAFAARRGKRRVG